MDNEKLIQLFLQGQLDKEGQKQLADLVVKDPEVASQLEIESAFYTKRTTSLKAELKAANISKNDIDTTRRPTKVIKLITSIAAALLVCVLCYFAINTNNIDQNHKTLASELLTQKHIAPVSLMGENTNKENWNKAIQAYKGSDYKSVIASISLIEEPTDEQILYIGISKLYLEKPDPKSAIKDFEKILMNKESIVSDQAQWFTALSQINLNNKVAAKKILTSIVQSKSWQYANAKQLLISID